MSLSLSPSAVQRKYVRMLMVSWVFRNAGWISSRPSAQPKGGKDLFSQRDWELTSSAILNDWDAKSVKRKKERFVGYAQEVVEMHTKKEEKVEEDWKKWIRF